MTVWRLLGGPTAMYLVGLGLIAWAVCVLWSVAGAALVTGVVLCGTALVSVAARRS